MSKRGLSIADIKEGEKLATVGGFEVVKWSRVERPMDTFFPIRAMIKCEDGEVRELPFTHNGRRFINVRSKYDLIIPSKTKVSLKRKPCNLSLNTMPDPIMGIHYIKTKQYERISTINRDRSVYDDQSIIQPSIKVMV